MLGILVKTTLAMSCTNFKAWATYLLFDPSIPQWLTLPAGNAEPSTRDRIAGPLSLVQQDCGRTTTLQHAIQLNLARATMLNSYTQEAIDQFAGLEQRGKVFITYPAHTLHTFYPYYAHILQNA